jgi:hypothetical protein
MDAGPAFEPTPHAAGVHLPFDDVPPPIRAWAERVGGGPVAHVSDRAGGFSPGCCALVGFEGGRRAFIKAVGPELNRLSPAVHRREAVVAASLPAMARVPRLIDAYDDGDWVALMFEEVVGSLPRTPWKPGELELVLRELTSLHEALTPCPIDGIETVSARHGELLSGWASLAETTETPDLDPWTRRRLERLVELERACPAALDDGETLVHADIRSDNVMLTGSGAVFVDWPHAARGARVFDVVCWAPSVTLEGGPDPDALLRRYRPAARCDAEALDAMVAGVAGYFTHHSTLPDPPGLPTLRAFQRAQGEVARAWLRERTGLR